MSQQQRSFPCQHCSQAIFIPANLPPTTAPCPHCGNTITSPAFPVASEPLASPQAGGYATASNHPSSETNLQDGLANHSEEKRSILAGIVSLLVIGGIAVAGILWYLKKNQSSRVAENNKTRTQQASYEENAYKYAGWKEEAFSLLKKFLAAKTPEEKAQYVIGGNETLERVRKIYGDHLMDESETTVESFAPVSIGNGDTDRGIYLMSYNRPFDLDIKKFFKPLANLEEMSGLVTPSIITLTFSNPINFADTPLNIHAFFVKKPEGMKLDWETYLQTRHRSFNDFMQSKLLNTGDRAVFRLIVQEEAPLEKEKNQKIKIYRLTDPASGDDSYRLAVPSESEVAKQLSLLNWYGIQGKRIVAKSATIELERTAASPPKVAIAKLVCWEFLGVGGGIDAAAIQGQKSETPELPPQVNPALPASNLPKEH